MRDWAGSSLKTSRLDFLVGYIVAMMVTKTMMIKKDTDVAEAAGRTVAQPSSRCPMRWVEN